MPVRLGEAIWEGNFTDGKGEMYSKTNSFKVPYTAGSRFESISGSNPEELIGAAHAGCFSMALSKELSDAGFTPKKITTRSRVHLDKADSGFTITHVDIITETSVPGITTEKFNSIYLKSQKTCIVSQALKVPITYECKLIQE